MIKNIKKLKFINVPIKFIKSTVTGCSKIKCILSSEKERHVCQVLLVFLLYEENLKRESRFCCALWVKLFGFKFKK